VDLRFRQEDDKDTPRREKEGLSSAAGGILNAVPAFDNESKEKNRWFQDRSSQPNQKENAV
jgi:hypothetical protein